MKSRGAQFLRACLRWLTPSQWAVRLFGLPRSTGDVDQRGLIIIQIDGLGLRQLRRALKSGRMPFLRRILKRRSHKLHHFYSGIPSSTPAVQGELFYDVRCATPAFSFRDSETQRVVVMGFPDPAARVERRINSNAPGLLAGGSAYCNIYSGGAKEAHFCASTIGWGGLLEAANPISLLIWLAFNGVSVVRTAMLGLAELLLAVWDAARGAIAGRDLYKEITFIPARVIASVLLREWSVLGAAMDMARGLPVIHVNFIGYDEHSHRRGPGSKFAHWSLKGIDSAIRRLWRAAAHSALRNYDVWIYSDHGHQRTAHYEKRTGRTIQQAVADVLQHDSVAQGDAFEGVALRATWLGGGRVMRWLTPHAPRQRADAQAEVLVVGMGPEAFVYADYALTPDDKQRLAEKLTSQADVPAVLYCDANNAVHAVTTEGTWRLPEQVASLVGAGHPFVGELGDDLARLCRHRDAGDLVLLGWRRGRQALSFRIENGAHGGAGPDETRGFALLPPDAQAPPAGRSYLRPADLRRAALAHLGRTPTQK